MLLPHQVHRAPALAEHHVSRLVAVYQELWWSRGRTRADVERMLGSCVPIVLVDEHDQLISFCRIITDRVYKALICDVVVDEAYRGAGLGARIIDEALAEVADVIHVELYCAPDLVGFYQRWGFTTDIGGAQFMRLVRGGTSPQVPTR